MTKLTQEERNHLHDILRCKWFHDEYDENSLKSLMQDWEVGMVKHIQGLLEDETIILYRVVWAKEKSYIDLQKVGHHFSEEFLEECAIEDLFYANELEHKGFDRYEDCWLLTVEVPTTEINVEKTFWKRADFPYENEVNINGKVEVLKIEKCYP